MTSKPASKNIENAIATDVFNMRQIVRLFALCLWVFSVFATPGGHASAAEIDQFKSAWAAAAKGDHDSFRQIKDGLQGYVLYPYLQYEDYRNRRATVPVGEMAAFIESHEDWAFTSALRTAWLKSLAKKSRWKDLLEHSEGEKDTVLRCQRVRAQIILKQTDGAMKQAQDLWLSGKSQPDECDPVFTWLAKNDGITHGLAWERIRLSMRAGNRKMVAYLARFVPPNQRSWLDKWQQMNRSGYSRLEQAVNWPDNDITRMITAVSLQSLARKNAALAARKFDRLDRHFSWDETLGAGLLRDIALYSAVDLDDDAAANMKRVPESFRDSQLLEWWARFLLSREDWNELADVISQMPEDTRNDDRWRYWAAQAGLRSGNTKPPSALLQEIADKANYYGFLAADELGLPYSICPRQPDVPTSDIDRLAEIDAFQRALELRRAELNDWAIAEWVRAAARLPQDELKALAGLAIREDWHDRAIFALGNSGDLDFYEWRFPLIWEKEIKQAAAVNKLDPAWVYGTIRSESAMVETARSSANALGLMQVTPATAKRVAKRHQMAWKGIAQLRTAAGNLPIGTAYMRDLLDDFGQNPVLVSGSYNAGPNAVQRWLDTRPVPEAAIWLETLPYYETRDYIPRVLAFTTLYDWRLGGPVKRISSRMPDIESGKIGVTGSTDVVCRSRN